MKIGRAASYLVPLTLIMSAAVIVFAQSREAFVGKFASAISDALNEYDPDRQVRPAALEILNANEALSVALRSGLSENFEEVPGFLDDAEEALSAAGGILLEISGQEYFQSDGARFQNELFFLARDATPETTSAALVILGEACLENAERISTLLGGEGEIEILRSILTDVSFMRLVVATFYGLSEG